MENEIVVENMTKDYGNGRGIYDVSFAVKKGEVFGFLGPNGAGKSTTMRHLMGFAKPHQGQATILGHDCWNRHSKIMKDVGYLPGEVTLPDGLNGAGFLEMMQRIRKSKNTTKIMELMELFDLNIEGDVRKLSIGEKRKLAVVAAFMDDPQVLLLDEPTSGLDPIMQEVFIDFVKKEKQRGKTILLSSHIFAEVEALCDRIAIIKEGRIIALVNAGDVRHYKRKTFEITFCSMEHYHKFQLENFEVRQVDPERMQIAIVADNDRVNELIGALTRYQVSLFVEKQQTLEDYFMRFYKSERTFGGV